MKNSSFFIILIDLIILACFNTVFFLNLKEPVIQTWISYGFINFALLMTIFTPLLIRKSRSQYLFTIVNTSVSVLYFLITVIVGLISLIAKNFSVKFLLSFLIILTAIYFVIFLLLLFVGGNSSKNWHSNWILCTAGNIRLVLRNIVSKLWNWLFKTISIYLY